MNQRRVIDHQVLKYKFRTWERYDGDLGTYVKYMKTGEEEYFEYLIRVEISKGWTPQGDYYQKFGQFRQTMVKYQGFVTSKPPQLPQKKKVSWLDLFMNFFVWVFYLVIMLFLLGVGISVVVWIFIVYGLGFFTS